MRVYGYRCPAGALSITITDGVASRIEFDEKPSPALPANHRVATALDACFSGKPPGRPEDRCFDLGTNGFQQEVLQAAMGIPRGCVLTYTQVAEAIGRPGAARAVGNALACNPVPVLVPCHRVVASTGLGGYKGGLEFKRYLLELEGALQPA